MKCPTCPDSVLVMADRSGIEIDYCPTCRGVWLDRGELDKIIERTAAPAPVAAPAPAPAPVAAAPSAAPQRPWYDDDDDDYRRSDDSYKYKKKKKPSSLLGELFDF
jgi:Zn-finger nucleic acid-binding protein